MRRKENEQDSRFALELFKTCEYATLATISPDNMPYCIPISPFVLNDTIYFHCATAGLKLEYITQHPDVCLSCVGHTKLVPEKFTTEFESAVAMGRCEIVQEESEKIAALRILCEKYAAGNMEKFDHLIAKTLDKTTVVRLHLQQITGKVKHYNQ